MTAAAKHTPEPWHLGIKQAERIVYDQTGWAVANCTVYHGKDQDGEAKANARRIVACVNACAGIPTESLELCRADLSETYMAVKAQRDELEKALRFNAEQVYAEFMTLAPNATPAQIDTVMGHVREWRAALAKLEGA